MSHIARIYKTNGCFVFFPWSKLTLLKRYHCVFQVVMKSGIAGINFVSPDWTFKSKHIEEKWDDLTIIFLAPDIKTTEVSLTIKNWKCQDDNIPNTNNSPSIFS